MVFAHPFSAFHLSARSNLRNLYGKTDTKAVMLSDVSSECVVLISPCWFKIILSIAMLSSKKLIVISVVGVVLLGLGIWQFKPLYHKVKDIRSGYLSHAAYELYTADPFDETALEQAALKAQTALFLSPENYEANRVMAAILMYVSPATSLKYWEQSRELWQKQEPISFSDQMNYVQVLILNNRLDVARSLLTKLKVDESEESEIDYNLAKISVLKGERNLAIQYARKMVENLFTPVRRQLFFIGLCLQSDDPAVRREGERHIRVLVENEDLINDSILWDITQFRGLSPDLSAMVKEKLDGKVNAYDERIALAEYQVLNKIKTPPDAYLELKAALFKEDMLSVVNLAKWCSKYNLTDQVLDLLSIDTALLRKDWFLLYVKNLGKAGRWADIVAILDKRDCPIEPFWISMLKAQACFEMGEESKAINSWYRAKLISQPVLEQYWLLIRLGDQMGLREDTKDLLDDLVSLGASPEQVVAYLCDQELATGNWEELYAILSTYKDRYPEHPDIVNDWAYYAILMDHEDETLIKRVDELVEAHPDQLRFHMIWALAQIKKGAYRQVLARLQQFNVDWMQLHPKWRFILALALAGVGEFEQAQAYLEEVDLGTLNPYETALHDKVFYNR